MSCDQPDRAVSLATQVAEKRFLVWRFHLLRLCAPLRHRLCRTLRANAALSSVRAALLRPGQAVALLLASMLCECRSDKDRLVVAPFGADDT